MTLAANSSAQKFVPSVSVCSLCLSLYRPPSVLSSPVAYAMAPELLRGFPFNVFRCPDKAHK